VRTWLLAAVLATGCLDSPPAGIAADARPDDAAPPVCVCPDEPCPFARSIVMRNQGISAALTDVPVLVRFDTTANMAPDGADLRFATTDGEVLPHEVELFPEEGEAAVWVGLPLVTPGPDTRFCLFYGGGLSVGSRDPTNVWDAGFAGVWHLGESGSGVADEFADSSANQCAGTGGDGAGAQPPIMAAGVIGSGQAFSSNQGISFGNGAHVDLTGTEATLEGWAQLGGIGPSFQALLGKEGNLSGYRMLVGDAGEILFQLTYDERRLQTPVGTINTSEWHYLVATYDGAALRIYVDGRLVKEGAGVGSIDGTEVDLIAGVSNSQYYLDGLLDELRVSSVARPADWITLQWGVVAGGWVTVGAEQAL
jgi:hypothetical protein